MAKRVAVWAWLALLSACASAEYGAREGESCVRLSQCAQGLACVQGMCSADLSALAEAGMVPILDSGSPMDVMSLPDVPVVENDAGN